MAVEIEKKYRLTEADYKRIRADLAEFKARCEGRDFEENIIYANDSLEDSGAILRVRLKSGSAMLTYKRYVPGGRGMKEHVEYETDVSSGAETVAIIEALGFERRLVYEKRRETWRLRNVEVVLDELPFGLFMEIEGSAAGILEAEMILEAEDLAVENETYPRLTERLGVKNGRVAESRFSQATTEGGEESE